MVGDNPLSLKFPPIKLYSLKKGKPISDCVVLSHLGLSLEFRFCKGVRKSEIESPNDQGSRVWILSPMVTSCCNAFFSAPASSLSLELSSEICMKYFRPSHLPVGWEVGLSYLTITWCVWKMGNQSTTYLLAENWQWKFGATSKTLWSELGFFLFWHYHYDVDLELLLPPVDGLNYLWRLC